MGNCECGLEQYQGQYNQKNWLTTFQSKNYTLIQSQFNDNLRLQKWFSNIKQNESIYQWRAFQNLAVLPHIYYYEKRQGDAVKLYQQNQHIVITDIVEPIKHIPVLKRSEADYILKAVFEGLNILVGKFGYFVVDQDLVFLSKKGKINVWVNSNLASNLVENPLNRYIQEEEYVQNVILVIERKVMEKTRGEIAPKMKIRQALDYYATILRKNAGNSENVQGLANIRSLKVPTNSTKYALSLKKEQKPFIQSMTTGPFAKKNSFHEQQQTYQSPKPTHNRPYLQMDPRSKSSSKDPDKMLNDLIKSENIYF